MFILIIFSPGIELEDSKNEDSLLISNHDRFKLRRQTSLVPKNEVKKNASPQPRVRVITRKSPSPLRKLSTPTQRKRVRSCGKQEIREIQHYLMLFLFVFFSKLIEPNARREGKFKAHFFCFSHPPRKPLFQN